MTYYDYSDFSIRKVSLEGGTPQLVVPASLQPYPSFSMMRDRNEMLVCINHNLGSAQFAFVSVDTGKIISQIPVGSVAPVCALSLTPDGKGIGVFPCRKTTSDIWIVPLDGSSPHQLTYHAPSRVADSIWMFDWSPDGKRLALSRRTYKQSRLF